MPSIALTFTDFAVMRPSSFNMLLEMRMMTEIIDNLESFTVVSWIVMNFSTSFQIKMIIVLIINVYKVFTDGRCRICLRLCSPPSEACMGNVVSRVSQRSSKTHGNEVVDRMKEPMRKDYV